MKKIAMVIALTLAAYFSTLASSVIAEAKEQVQLVVLTNTEFSPKSITVKRNSTVTWRNKEGSHAVESDEGLFKSPPLDEGKDFTFTFSKSGTFHYHCPYHGAMNGSGMAGTVVVK